MTNPLEGKITALAPSFLIMAEMTGKDATASVVGLYTKHFVDEGLAMNDVNVAVETIMVSWQRPYWPSPEAITLKTREYARQSSSAFRDRFIEIHSWSLEEGLRQWEHRVHMANEWRVHNPTRFKPLLQSVDSYGSVFLERLAWMTESQSYRKAFRDGAVVQACNNMVGSDERAVQRRMAAEREARATQFAATGTIENAA